MLFIYLKGFQRPSSVLGDRRHHIESLQGPPQHRIKGIEEFTGVHRFLGFSTVPVKRQESLQGSSNRLTSGVPIGGVITRSHPVPRPPSPGESRASDVGGAAPRGRGGPTGRKTISDFPLSCFGHSIVSEGTP